MKQKITLTETELREYITEAIQNALNKSFHSKILQNVFQKKSHILTRYKFQ